MSRLHTLAEAQKSHIACTAGRFSAPALICKCPTPVPWVRPPPSGPASLPTGANTCFVNVIIQMLWGIEAFRSAFFRQGETHRCATGTAGCVFCAMLQVFKALNDQTQRQPIETEVLQMAISVLNSGFAFGEKQDATEVCEAILNGKGCLLRLCHRPLPLIQRHAFQPCLLAACVLLCPPHPLFLLAMLPSSLSCCCAALATTFHAQACMTRPWPRPPPRGAPQRATARTTTRLAALPTLRPRPVRHPPRSSRRSSVRTSRSMCSARPARRKRP